MEQDQDKPFSGNKVNFDGTLEFRKIGRVGLNGPDLELNASVDMSAFEY